MSRMQNTFDLTGHVGADAEVRALPNGQMVATVRLAVSNTYVDKDTKEVKEVTDWFRVSCYGKRADWLNKYGKTGAGLRMSGHLKSGFYDHKTFKNDESGAVTVDWVVLTAAIVGLGMVVMQTVGGGIEGLGQDIVTNLEGRAAGYENQTTAAP